MEVDVLEKADEHLVGRIVLTPDVEGSHVVRSLPRTVGFEVADELGGIERRAAGVMDFHQRVRPRSLYRVAHEEDDAGFGHNAFDVGDPSRVEDCIARSHFTGDPPVRRREERAYHRSSHERKK